jgi:CTP synthase (UTP-ammonia lyase)
VIEGRDVQSIYEVPLMYEKENLPGIVIEKLNLNAANLISSSGFGLSIK